MVNNININGMSYFMNRKYKIITIKRITPNFKIVFFPWVTNSQGQWYYSVFHIAFHSHDAPVCLGFHTTLSTGWGSFTSCFGYKLCSVLVPSRLLWMKPSLTCVLLVVLTTFIQMEFFIVLHLFIWTLAVCQYTYRTETTLFLR